MDANANRRPGTFSRIVAGPFENLFSDLKGNAGVVFPNQTGHEIRANFIPFELIHLGF